MSTDDQERDRFYAAYEEATRLTGHKPSMYDVWLMARGLMTADGRRYQAPASQAPSSTQAEPVAWIRYCSDGGYEGPLLDVQMEEVRKRSGAWTPLYAATPAAAPADPIKGKRYEAGDWSMRNYEAYLEDQGTAAAPAPEVPSGWRLVPEEPTEEMASAAGDAWWTYDDHATPRDSAVAAYRAMLAAAPLQEPNGTGSGEEPK